jgi:hypothetical protein
MATNNTPQQTEAEKQKQPVKGEVDPKDSFSKSTTLASQYAMELKQKRKGR